MTSRSWGPCTTFAFDSCDRFLVTRVHHRVGAKEPHKGCFLIACNVSPCEFACVCVRYLVFMATPTAAPTQGKPCAALIIFDNSLVVVACWCPSYAILHFSFRMADLYPTTWLPFFFFPELCYDSLSSHTS